MNAYLVVHDTHAQRVEAETPEGAALQASRKTSVGSLRAGVTYSVFPIDFVRKVKVQYERPQEGGDHGFGDNLGEPIVVNEFVDVPRLSLLIP